MNTQPSARRTTTPDEMAFATIFGIPPRLAAILADLQSRKTTRALRVHIHALRQALPCEAIDTTKAGYLLTEVGEKACADALRDFRAWIGMKEGRVA